LILVNHDGDVVYGSRPVNRAAFVLHAAVHKARPDINAAAHAHSVFGKAWSSLGRLLDPITQDACAFYNDHVLIDDVGGKVVFEIEDGIRFAEKFGNYKAAIHQNHGLFTTGETVDAAAYAFITMERSCQAQLMAEAAGKPKLIPHEWAEYTRNNTAFPAATWLNFQPLWDDIVQSDPDLFD
jgi:ribulose-5-phosphate 4-epimerase/fuculose-1-phosphate aldolase